MAEYQRSPAPRGQVHYSSEEPVQLSHPQGYFQPRLTRPQILRVGRPQPLPEAGLSKRRRRIRKREISHSSTRITSAKEGIRKFIRKNKLDIPLQEQELGAHSLAHTSFLSDSASLQVASERNASVVSNNSASSSSPPSTDLTNMTQRSSLVEEVRLAPGTPIAGSQPTILGPTPENDKPVASGNGVSVSINLAEPILFLQGFDPADFEERNTSMLRGSLHLRVTKTAKIKTIYLKFRGRAETEWPEGIPPKRAEYKSTESLMNHTWPFFNAAWQNSDSSHGADNVQPLKGSATATTREIFTGINSSTQDPSKVAAPTSKEMRRLSLQEVQSKSFGKNETNVAQKGYRTFQPGNYIYNFELPIDSRLPETIDVELGDVKYELEAIVERAGAFRANLVGSKEVVMIRAPTEGSLETVEPIAISRDWEDQLHYDIVISGKSFPLGSQVPIAFKLTPLAKVRCHRIKVFVTENIQYFTSNKRVHRMEPTRRVQLFEKCASGHSTSAYPGSSLRITAGGGVEYDSRIAAAMGDESVPRDNSNLLGPLEGEHASVGPTEMEINVQLPSCQAMDEREKAARLHFDTTYTNIQVHHWIKIVMRLSRPDTQDPTRHRHFEISIDSPFHILSCRATQANMALPAYSSPESSTLLTDHSECGCPGAPRRRNFPLNMATTNLSSLRNQASASTTSLPSSNSEDHIAPPPAAYVHDQANDRGISDPRAAISRPIHLLRAPSFNPPPFSDEDMPPPLITPPPNYETAVNGDPREALADYFSRLADEVGEYDEEVSATARMEMPLTPGGRINRSMDERRTWLGSRGVFAS